jgi:hypothetical protein
LKNPYYIGDEPALTNFRLGGRLDRRAEHLRGRGGENRRRRRSGQLRAEKNLRRVVKGGHSYQGRSNAPDSLLIWTRAMNDIVLHDAFVAQGCEGKQEPQPAASIGAGATWASLHAVTTKGPLRPGRWLHDCGRSRIDS